MTSINRGEREGTGLEQWNLNWIMGATDKFLHTNQLSLISKYKSVKRWKRIDISIILRCSYVPTIFCIYCKAINNKYRPCCSNIL